MATGRWIEHNNPTWDARLKDIYQRSVEFNAEVASKKPGDTITLPATDLYPASTWVLQDDGDWVPVEGE